MTLLSASDFICRGHKSFWCGNTKEKEVSWRKDLACTSSSCPMVFEVELESLRRNMWARGAPTHSSRYQPCLALSDAQLKPAEALKFTLLQMQIVISEQRWRLQSTWNNCAAEQWQEKKGWWTLSWQLCQYLSQNLVDSVSSQDSSWVLKNKSYCHLHLCSFLEASNLKLCLLNI